MLQHPRSEVIQRLNSGYGLPALSPVALKLVELASDEKSSANQLVEIIEKDPSLAVRLLKLANSAFYGSSSRIKSLFQAVVRVGFDRLRIMALSISLRDTFPFGKVGPLDYEKFWKVSLYRGIMSRTLARHRESVNPEEAFVAGLIMEIGLLIFFDLFIKGKDQDVSLELEPLEEMLSWERAQFGIDHREIGMYALRHWKFPESIVNCQRPRCLKDLKKEGNDLCMISELARICSQAMFQEGGNFNTIFTHCEKTIGLEQEEINNLILESLEQVDVLAQELNLENDKGKDLIGLMEKANRALSQISERISTQSLNQRPTRTLPTLNQISNQSPIICDTLQAVVHEIRNPLTAVGGFARRLASTLDPHSEEGKYVRIILGEASRLEKLLQQMTQKEFPGCST